MRTTWTLKARLILFFLLIGLIPLGAVGFSAYRTASVSLSDQVFNQLVAIRDGRRSHILQWLGDMVKPVRVEANNPATLAALRDFTAAFAEGGLDGDAWKKADKAHGAYLKGFNSGHHYYDVFLIDLEGNIVWSATREADLGTNLVNGEYSHTGLAAAFQGGKARISLTDFEWYDPSNEPGSFLAAPVKDGTALRGVLAAQVAISHLSEMLASASGLGQTGEAYLIGSDGLRRSNSRLDAAGTVLHSFKDKVKVETPMVRAALSGQTDATIGPDYRGAPVLSAYAPLEFMGLQWAVLCEIDEAEAFAPVRSLQTNSLMLAVIAGLIVSLIGWLIARSIATPIDAVISSLSAGADQVSSAATQISSSSQQLSDGASSQASSLEETSSSLEEVSSMSRQNADNAREASKLAEETRDTAQQGASAMGDMTAAMEEINESSDRIGKIVRVIEEIASKTDLLALNAAVEAARAGEAGKGFAVVADEVRNLAQRAAESTKETTALIEDTAVRVQRGTEAAQRANEILGEIVLRANDVVRLVGEIAASSVEQAQGIAQVNDAVTLMDRVTQQNAASAEETASASEELAAQSESLRDAVIQLLDVVGGNQELAGTGAVLARANGAGRTKAKAKASSHDGVHRLIGGKAAPNGAGEGGGRLLALPADGGDSFSEF